MVPGLGNYHHTPVMLEQVLAFLKPAPGKIMLDATLGGGGHAEAILQKLLPGGKLIGIDQDSDALEAAGARLAHFGEAFCPAKANFGQLKAVMEKLGYDALDGLLFDLGISSYQVDCPGRGFSYRDDVFLDMRMDRDLPQTAAGLLKELPARELARIFREYGEEKWAMRIASSIVSYRRSKGPVSRSSQLVEIIRGAVPAAARRKGGHPAKRVFQALRIAVNNELKALKTAIIQGIELLQPGGRIVVIAYHSLEDEIVKKQFRESARGCICPPGVPVCRCNKVPVITVLTKKPLYADPQEVTENSRARSARLRAAEKAVQPYSEF